MHRRFLSTGLVGFVLLLSAAGVASAKEGAEAALDAPIPPGAEPGTKIEIGWKAWWPDGAGDTTPVTGSPVFIRLTSVDGTDKVEMGGKESPAGSGHYAATVTVPPGGVGLVEIGLRSESCVNGTCTRWDMPFLLSDADRIPARAAPVVPAAEPVAPDPVAPARVTPAPVAASPASGVPVVLGIAGLGFAGSLVLAVVLRRGRRSGLLAR